ncbi:MAG: O-antigen ligase family protein [Candidatus Aminicenantes bacterium]|nr:MAG: O-antigen ligase family protein [Candidatus Aminicenantes bacterium]
MVVWFFPAFVALMIIRHGFSKPKMVKILFWGMIVNASLLAIFGLIAPLLVENYPLWLKPILPRQDVLFFSTFGYPNHAGSFFILHLGLACGLFFYYYANRKHENQVLVKTGILLVSILLLLYVIHLTHSRYAMLFSWLTTAFFTFHLLYLSIGKDLDKRLKIGIIAIVVVGLIVIGLFALYHTAKGDILSKLTKMSEPGKFINEQFDLKFWQVVAAAKMWRDYPLFGIGGGSYREYLLQYVRNHKERYIATHYWGMAYVHNDLMQFLCEFGIIGTGLLAAVFLFLVSRIAASRQWKQGFFFFGLLGAGGVFIHSLIDLPFRSPPVIIAFVVILAGYGILQTQQRHQEQITKKKGSFISFVTRFVNFYTLVFLFISIVMWWILTPIRQKVSQDIVREVKREYEAKLITFPYNNVTPGISQNASPALLRSLWWAKLLYAEYKELHLLSAKINFDLYRNASPKNEKGAKSYLKEAFRSSLTARRFTTYGDIEFIKLHTAVLDALGYYLEESWCLKCLRDIYAKDIRVNRLVREFYFRRPYLYR